MFFNFVVPRREEALSLRIKQGPERPVEAFYFLSILFLRWRAEILLKLCGYAKPVKVWVGVANRIPAF